MRNFPHWLLPLLLTMTLAACQQPAIDGQVPSQGSEPSADAPAAPEPVAATTSDQDPLAFELTMDKVDAYFAAIGNIVALVEKDPALEDVTSMDASNEDTAQYIKRLESHPLVNATILQAGSTPRDYALVSESLLAAMILQDGLESGQIKQIPAGLNPQWIEFVKQHKAELAVKFQAAQSG